MDTSNYKPKSFWRKPEGVTGAIVLGSLLLGGGWIVINSIATIVALTSSMIGLAGLILALGLIIYIALDSKARSLLWYMYKSTMRWITGLFVQIDPIAILKNYVDDMSANLKKMNKQILQLRGQMHKLKELILINQKEIKIPNDLAKSKGW